MSTFEENGPHSAYTRGNQYLVLNLACTYSLRHFTSQSHNSNEISDGQVFGFLSVQYMLHLYAYLKEWYKNPQWSFSCCLALILPFLSLPGDVSGIQGANIMSNQLETGDIDMPTITNAVQDSGAIDISLEEGEESDYSLHHDQNYIHTANQLNTEKMEKPPQSTLAQTNEASKISFGEKKLEDGNTKVTDIIHTASQPKGGGKQMEAFALLSNHCSHKCHQGTQTKFGALCCIGDVRFKKKDTIQT